MSDMADATAANAAADAHEAAVTAMTD